jgi:hypothetical protein
MLRRDFLRLVPLSLLAAACDPVTLARRLLMAGGSGAFTPPAGLSPFALTSAPAGGWCWFDGPSAIHSGTKTYFGYLRGDNADLCARTVDDGTLTVGAEEAVYPNFKRVGEDPDDHNAPSILIRNSDGYVCMAFALHVGDIYFAVGASAGALPTGIGNVTNITSSAGGGPTDPGDPGYTYAGLAQVSAVANNLYIFCRWHAADNTAHLSYTKSTNNGATWGARVDVCLVTYHQFAVNGADRIDFVLSDHPDYAATSVYHCYFVPSTDKWYKSDGTEITASRPFAITAATLVYDGSTNRGWLYDIAIDGSGYPVVVYVVYDSPYNTGNWHYQYGRWTGSAWVTHEIANAGRAIYNPDTGLVNNYAGGVCLDHSDPTIVYASIGLGSDRWDVYRYHTGDGGASWSSVALTSSGKNIRPMSVQGHDPSLQVIWSEGTYTTYTDYSLRTMGAGI